MKKFRILTLMLFLFSFFKDTNLSAQIKKGLTSIDGNAEANYSNYRVLPIERRPAYENTYLAFTSSIDYFISDHFSLGGSFGFVKNSYFSIFNSDLGGQSFTLNPRIQYFFNPKSEWNLYTALELSYQNRMYEDSYKTNKEKFETYGANIILGVNHFINQQIAIDAKISFNVYRGSYSSYYRAFTEIKLKNFINLKETGVLENGNIAKNRKIIEGRILFTSETSDLTAQLNYGQFITNRLVVGGNVYILKRYNSTYPGIGVLPYIQYFYPINKKFFAQAKVFGGVGDGFYYGGSIGLNYFLTPYVMVEANLLEGSKISENMRILSTVGPNIGLKYFLQ